MELGFNIAWLILALALSLGWLRSAKQDRFHRSLLALMLLVMLLFPVISITDDIHQDYFNLSGEEVRYKDDLQHRLELARQHSGIASLPVIVPPFAADSLGGLRFERTISDHLFPQSRPGFLPTVFDLPPPQLS